MAIPYVKQTWIDGSGGGTPTSAARLAVIEQGIYDASRGPAVRVYHNAAQSVTTTTNTVLAFNSERYDQASGAAATHHDTVTNNSRLTCLYAGIYGINTQVEWQLNVTGERILEILLNGTTVIGRVRALPGASSGLTNQLVAIHYSLAVNDYVETRVIQTSGATLTVNSVGNFSPEFSMARVA